MNILYIADLPCFHTQNDLFVFAKNNMNAIVINTHNKLFEDCINLYDNRLEQLFLKANPFLGKIVLNRMNLKLPYIKTLVREYEIDLIYSAWSTDTLPEVKMLLKSSINAPMIHRFLIYPYCASPIKVQLENKYTREIVSKLDGIIYSTQNMAKYFKGYLDTNIPHIIFTEYLSEKYFFTQKSKCLSEKDGEPHIAFVGTVGYKPKWNNISRQIHEIARRQIHIHLPTNHCVQENSYIHFFRPFPGSVLIKGKLANFLTQFDAALVIYNFDNESLLSQDRFRNVIPNRFLFSLIAGIPIAMPKGQLPSCERLIEEFNVGFVYKSLEELEKKLKDFDFMRNLQKVTASTCREFTYENNFPIFANFVEKIMVSLKQ